MLKLVGSVFEHRAFTRASARVASLQYLFAVCVAKADGFCVAAGLWTHEHKGAPNRAGCGARAQVSKLLQYSPTTRLKALDALSHPFFDELRDPATRMPNGVQQRHGFASKSHRSLVCITSGYKADW